MTTTATRAALARLQALPWATYRRKAGQALQLIQAVGELLFVIVAVACWFAWEHRAEIASTARLWAVRAYAAVVLGAQLAYEAGAATRGAWEAFLQWSDRVAKAYAALIVPDARPIPASVVLEALSLDELRERLQDRGWVGLAELRRIINGED